MSGIGEASLALGIISSIISIINATKQVYEAVEDEVGLPTNFKKSAMKLPLILKLLEDAETYIDNTTDKSIKAAFTPTLEDCKVQATHLQQLFEKVMPKEDDSRRDRYVKAARTIGKGGRVEGLVGGILDDLQLLTTRFPEVTTLRGKDQLAKAIEEVTRMEPSLPDGFEQMPAYAHYGSGAQNINIGDGIQHNNSGTGNQNSGSGTMYIGTNQIISSHKNVTIDDIDRSCLRFLRCPDTLVVKNRLKENKDKLLYKSIDWILQDPQYISWKDGDDVCLLWIKGGAGKGKTMMSIGLIERLSLSHDPSVVVTYFFCQNADYELNTLGAIIKGLILQLVNQRKELKESLRCRWDEKSERFVEDVTSWRTLLDIFLEMLERCECQRLYVIVDALDECQDDGMADFLKRLVRTGLHRPSKIKWLLTSRPLDSANRELLAGFDQVLVSLELNSKHISNAVKTYIAFKMDELDRRCSYGETLRRKIETELTKKAEDTYLWVSLVCKRLESVHRDKALTTIQELPPGLHPFYNRVFNQLSEGEPDVVKGCMRLLKVMMLAYRPLNVAEVASVSGLSDEWVTIEALVDRCASFIKMRGITDIEFVHQSARDYLAGKNGQSIFGANEHYVHGEVALSCLSYLSQRLKVNLVDLPQPDSTRELMVMNKLVVSVDYAATFWVQHFERAKRITPIQNSLSEQGEVSTFLRTKLLTWLECLSLLDKLPRAIEALKILTDVADLKSFSLSTLVQDATRFLLRHYPTIATWPLQIYSSAIVFSPQTSVVRRNNLGKLPAWLRKLPQMEDSWASLIQTLAVHSSEVLAVAFSPDGKQIASGSSDKTIKLWDATTGDFQKTLAGHSGWVSAVAFSPDSKQIASGSSDKTIKLWDATTGDFQKTLASYSSWVSAVAFSPNSKQIASGSHDKTIKLWDATTGDLQKTLAGHSGKVSAVAFSPNSKQIASGSHDKTIKLWDATTGDLQKTLAGHSGKVSAVAFSPNSKQIASGSHDKTIKLWDATTGDFQKTLAGHSDMVLTIAFSPDSKQITSGSSDKTIKLWDAATGDFQKTLAGHSNVVLTVAFSPNSKQIASGSSDKTIKLWDATTGDLQKTLAGHSDGVSAVEFSPDSKQIASGSYDKTIKLWDATTSGFQKTLAGHSEGVSAVAFSPDGKQIASGSYDKTIKLWDATTGDFQKTLAGHSEGVSAVAFSPNSKQIASGSYDETIKLWDATTGDLQKTLAGHSDGVLTVAFSPDSKQIASGFYSKTIKLWNAITGDLQKTLAGHSDVVSAVEFSPNSKQIASGSYDKTIKLWDAITGDFQKTLAGHSDAVLTVAFSPDSKQIASGSYDKTIKLWDVANAFKVSRFLGRRLSSRLKFRACQEIKTLQTVRSLKFSVDSRHLTTNLGLVKIESTVNRQSPDFEWPENLRVNNQWICYKAVSAFLLPSDFVPHCYDVRGDQVAIGFTNGRVLIFDIDRISLNSMIQTRDNRIL